METVHFLLKAKFQGHRPILNDYNWFCALMTKMLMDANQFQMRCWPDDLEGIQDGLQFGNQLANTTTQELVFQGSTTVLLKEHLLNHFLDQQGVLKWFSIILFKDEIMLCSIEHYGTEPFIFHLSMEEADKLETFAGQYPSIYQVNRYDEEN